MTMELFQLRIPKETKRQLPVAAGHHNMTVPQYVRALLNLATSGRIELTLTQEPANDQPSRTHV